MARDNKPSTGAESDANTEKPGDIVSRSKTPTVFRKEDLIQSKAFSQYHPDFLRALLPDERYTMAAAEGIVTQYFAERRI